jgi:four helix bundle protein
MTKINDLNVYRLAIDICDEVWQMVDKWNYFEKDTLGKQIVRSADSIALNISEGYGRFHYAENKHFCYYSRGSAFETITALELAKKRGLILETDYTALNVKLISYLQMLNKYIQSIGKTNN